MDYRNECGNDNFCEFATKTTVTHFPNRQQWNKSGNDGILKSNFNLFSDTSVRYLATRHIGFHHRSRKNLHRINIFPPAHHANGNHDVTPVHHILAVTG